MLSSEATQVVRILNTFPSLRLLWSSLLFTLFHRNARCSKANVVICVYECLAYFNPFTTTVCKISGLKDVHKMYYKQYIFRSYNTSIFNAMRFDENPFTRQ